MATSTLKKIAPVDIGAVAKTGDTMTGDLTIKQATARTYLNLTSESDQPADIRFSNANASKWALTSRGSSDSNFFGLYNHMTNGYAVQVANDNTVSLLKPLPVGSGGTGATTAEGARANIGAASDSAAMQFRGWYPNGQSMLSLTPGYYQTKPDSMPSQTFPNDISEYGILCVGDTGYTYITYISVLGDFMFWKSNGPTWYVVQYHGYVPVSSGGTGATTAAQARTNLEITPGNIGALAKTGDTMSGPLTVQHSGEVNIHAKCTDTNVDVALESAVSGNHGIWSYGYRDGSGYVHDEKWLIYRNTNGKIIFNDTLGIDHGGTGATTYAQARKNLQIGERIASGSGTIKNQPAQSNFDPTCVYSNNGQTWTSPTLETGLYLFDLWVREQGGGGCTVTLMINASGTGDSLCSEYVPDWGILHKTFIVEITSSYVYIWHRHSGTTHTTDMRVNIYRLR